MNEELMKDLRDFENAERLRQVIEVVPNGMVIVDQDCQIVLANNQTEDIFGYRRDELVGRPFVLLIPDRFHESHIVFNNQYFANPVPRSMGRGHDLFGRRKDGSEVPIEIGFTPLKASNGFFILNEIVEITVRKQLEEKALRIKEIEAQESERRKLARELHDELGQLLCAISVGLQRVKDGCGSAAPQLDDSIQRVEKAIEQVQNLSLDLRSPMLDDLGLVATLRWYADRQAQSAGLVLNFVAEPSATGLPSDLATTCYRVVQEALANIIRHAHASTVWIEFHENQEELRLSIRDDGIGLNSILAGQPLSGKSSFGLLGMRERVEILGGQLKIASVQPHGTLVDARIPMISRNS